MPEAGGDEPQVGEEPSDEQHHPRRQRQVGVEFLEQRLELRQHVAGEDEHRDERHHHDDHRIRQRRDHLGPGVDLTFEVLGQALEDVVELTGQLGRLQDADVVLGEHLGVRGGSGREQAAVAEVLDQLAERPSQCDVLGLVTDRHQRVGDRDAGLDEHRELTREVHQLLLLDLLLGQLEVEHAAAFLDLGREQVLLDEHRRARHRSCRPWSPPRRGRRRCRWRRRRTWACDAPCLSVLGTQWANRVRTTSGMVVTSSSTICIASRSIVRIP